jgi:hypothetical protein
MGRASSTYMEKRNIYLGFWWESPNERDQNENLHVGKRKILRRILEK